MRFTESIVLLLFGLGALTSCLRSERVDEKALGDPERGKVALQQYVCTGCHVIPGVIGANSRVGPPLDAIARRTYLAGFLPNTPENMIKWLMDPQQLAPESAMPDLGVTENDARDIAAYLYSLE